MRLEPAIRRPPSHQTIWVGVALFVWGSVACADTGETTCLPELPADCAPLYAPTFDQVYTQTLQAKCAVAGGACHSSEGAKGGLILEGIDVAYANLVEADGRIVPFEPGCGELSRRLESTDPTVVMPVGGGLSEPERCAIQMWIRAGAAR